MRTRFVPVSPFMASLICLVTVLAAGTLPGIATADESHFSVRVVGQGPPVILIPGLTCDGSVWDATVDQLKDRFQLHIVSIAGFGVVPPVDGDLLPNVRSELVDYMRQEKLDHPVIIGHSLGGFLGIWIAATEPDLVKGVVSVDGVPYLAALQQPEATAESMTGPAEQIRDYLKTQSPETFATQSKLTMQMMVRDAETASELSGMTSKSSPATVGQAMYELMLPDLRGELSNIRVPVLALVPAEPAFPGIDGATLQTRYRRQFDLISRHRIEFIPDVRHFVMIDAPDEFVTHVTGFLNSPAKFVEAAQSGPGPKPAENPAADQESDHE